MKTSVFGSVKVVVVSSEKQEAKLLKLSMKDYRHLQDLERFEQAASAACSEEKTPVGRSIWRTAAQAVSSFREAHGLDPEGNLTFL